MVSWGQLMVRIVSDVDEMNFQLTSSLVQQVMMRLPTTTVYIGRIAFINFHIK